MQEKVRLDLLLLERKLASTRTKAQELIAEGHVLVAGLVCQKAGEKFSPDAEIHLKKEEHPYVSRGGVKLAGALAHFSIDVKNKIALDIGLSTGGFTDCLLQKGVAKVYGIDVGTQQLAHRLHAEPRLQYWENLHIKELRPEQLGERVDLLVADLSFISLTKVIPLFRVFLKESADILLLVKPQFELGPQALDGKGIVKQKFGQEKAIKIVAECLTQHAYIVQGTIPSPILGGDGNHEHFLHAVLRSPAS